MSLEITVPLWNDRSYEIKRWLLLGRKVSTNLDTVFKSKDISLPTKIHIVTLCFFSSSHVWKWELDHKEGWVPKNWCFWTVVLEKTFESPLDCKIKSVNPKGNQLWILTGRTDAEAEAPTLWPPVAKSWLIGKDSDAGKDWGQKEKGVTEDEMVGWHHRFNGHEFEQTLGAGEGQGKPDLLPSMASHRVGHDLVTEQQLWNHRHHECHKHNHHLQKCPLGFWSFVYLLTCAMNTYIRFTLLAHF